MSMIGVLGGMGPAATVDFLDKVVRLTPASRDQEHIPVIAASLPHVPDRSACILGTGEDPLPSLLRGIDLLNDVGVGVVVVPCNSSHHWYDEICARSKAPVLHIAKACVERIAQPRGSRVLVLATRGALRSGFYQRELARVGLLAMTPDLNLIQPRVDDCIRQVKSGEIVEAGVSLSHVLAFATEMAVSAVIMGCTEIPIAARYCNACGIELADSSLALAEAAVNHAVERQWHLASQIPTT
jgi:aspartate racemase